MPSTNFKPSTYDIYCRENGRWRLHSCFLNEEAEEALTEAKRLDGEGGFEGIRLMHTKYPGSSRGAVEIMVWVSPRIEREVFKPKPGRPRPKEKTPPRSDTPPSAPEPHRPGPVEAEPVHPKERLMRRIAGGPSHEALAAKPVSPSDGGGIVTILFTDIVGSTRMTQERGDQAAQAVVRAHNTIVRKALSAHGGREVKHTGDGIMAGFPRATAAIEAARDIQRGIAEHRVRNGAASFEVRIGLNAGEPVSEEGDFFGTAVQIAARVCDKAGAQQIFVTEAVRGLAAGHDLRFAPAGHFALKGIDEEMTLFEVVWQEAL